MRTLESPQTWVVEANAEPSLRFPPQTGSASTMQEMYSTALDICQWGERNNAVTAMFSEHHSSPDGYLPSPIIMAAAAAARTETLTFNVGALRFLCTTR
ncbi:MAG: hypothetical protein CM15mP49_00030 [Actinomycetota bacterium]|nr:MAG: hypothetical protein CM15mP49_00030 [Actinomycetota bacterium]